MRRPLVACTALLLACNPAPPSGKEAPTKAAEAKTPGKTDAKAPDAKAPDAKAPEPVPVAPTVKLEAATVALLDRLVPAADRVAVDEAAAKRLKVEPVEFQLWVVDGTRRAPLERRGDTLHGLGVTRAASGAPMVSIDFEDSAYCGDTHQVVEISASALFARIEHASGLEHHGKGEYEAAAKRFAQAALLDPSRDETWLGLARALAKHADVAGAMAALDPMLRRAPMLTYHHVLAEADLASLRDQAALTALRAPKAGDVDIETMTLAYSAHHSLVAVVRKEESWGSSAYVQELRLYGSKTGEQVLSVLLTDMAETDPERGKVSKAHRATVDARFAAAERFLRDMGFATTKDLEVVRAPKGAEDSVIKLELPKAGLAIELDEEHVRLLKGAAVLVERPQTSASGIVRGGHDPTAGVAFVEWYAQVPEGCAFDEDGAGYYVLPVPAAP